MIEFCKVRNVKSPNRAHFNDAGMDFFIPWCTKDFIKDLKEKNKGSIFINEDDECIEVGPHEKILIPSGIKMNLPEGYMLMAANKSGIASKYGLIRGAEIIDESYLGEIHINLINTTNNLQFLYFGQKIIQLICVPVKYIEPKEIEEKEFNKYLSDRGDGGFGSTGE